MSKTRDHYIPAAFIGRFSFDLTEPLRRRTVWVARRSGAIYSASAEYEANQRGFYSTSHGVNFDDAWSFTEAHLIAALDRLESTPQALAASDWIVLVQFVAELFVRGPDFVQRYTRRMETLFQGQYDDVIPDQRGNTIVSMVIERQRLLWPVMTSGWTVLRASGDTDFVTSDVGYAPTVHVDGRQGYVIPVGRQTAIAIMTDQQAPHLAYADGMWRTDGIMSARLSGSEVLGANLAVARSCLSAFFGQTEASVDLLLKQLGSERPDFGPELLLPADKSGRVDSEWMRRAEQNFFDVLATIGSTLAKDGVHVQLERNSE